MIQVDVELQKYSMNSNIVIAYMAFYEENTNIPENFICGKSVVMWGSLDNCEKLINNSRFTDKVYSEIENNGHIRVINENRYIDDKGILQDIN